MYQTSTLISSEEEILKQISFSQDASGLILPMLNHIIVCITSLPNFKLLNIKNHVLHDMFMLRCKRHQVTTNYEGYQLVFSASHQFLCAQEQWCLPACVCVLQIWTRYPATNIHTTRLYCRTLQKPKNITLSLS